MYIYIIIVYVSMIGGYNQSGDHEFWGQAGERRGRDLRSVWSAQGTCLEQRTCDMEMDYINDVQWELIGINMNFNDVNCKLGINYQLDIKWKWVFFCFGMLRKLLRRGVVEKSGHDMVKISNLAWRCSDSWDINQPTFGIQEVWTAWKDPAMIG